MMLVLNKIKKVINDIKEAFLQEFSSVKLAIALFIFLAIATLIGTVLPEEPMVGSRELIQKYGLKKYHFLKSIGLTDVFHSWWYLALLTTLGINLIVASFRRVFPKWYIAFAWPVDLKPENIKNLPINCEIPAMGSTDLKIVEQKLKQKNYKTKITGDKLFAVKGGWHRLGASVTHIGILILLFGSALSILTGFNGMVQLSENEGFYVADLDQATTQVRASEPGQWLAPVSKMPVWFGSLPRYLIKVNKTWREDYKTGQPKQWFSDLSVLNENKNELKRKVIHVNDPLQFMGLDIYQSNWGRFADVGFNDERVSLPLENFKGEEVVFLPLSEDIGLKLKIVDEKTNDIVELYSILRLNNEGEMKEKYIGRINAGKMLQVGPLNINYYGTQTLTGLQFKSNPGDNLIYPAIFFIFVGVFIAFGSRKQIWAAVNSENKKIVIGGNSDRAKGRFFKEFEEMINELVNK